ncbi:MAG: ATP-binding protein [bacterium]
MRLKTSLPTCLVSAALLFLCVPGVYADAENAVDNLIALESQSEAQLCSMLDTTEGDTRGHIHAMLGRMTIDRDPTLARSHLRSADALISDNNLVGRSYLDSVWCWVDMLVADINKAQQRCESSLVWAEASGQNWALTKAFSASAILHYQRGELATAYDFGSNALDRSLQVGVADLIASQYNLLGLVSRAQGRFENALDYFARGLEILDPLLNEEMYRVVSFNVGIAYADLGQYQIAKDFYAPTLQWTREADRHSKELTALTYTASADVALGEHDAAIAALTAALERPELRENHGYLAFAYAVLGEAYLADDQAEAALLVFERGMRIYEADPNTFEQRRVRTGYAQALFANGRIDEAREVVLGAVTQLRAENARMLLLTALNLLGELEEAAGNYQASLVAHKESARLAREFQQQSVNHQLTSMRDRFEVVEAERELADAEQETIVLTGMILLVLAFGFIGYLGVTRRAQRLRAEAEANHAERLERVVSERTSELQAKIEQINNAESARIALERQLSEAEKLRVLGQLTGGVAHDFNNLLTVVTGAAELLKESVNDSAEERLLIDHILTAADSGADITRALMAYARKQPLQLETVNLKEVLRQRMPLVARTLGGMVNLQLNIDGRDDVRVVLDESQLTSAMLNLALNARDAQNNQGDIEVSLDVRDGRWAVVAVTDAGCGMTQEQIDRAVEPFYTTKEDAHGTGLGLSMVYGFSKQIGGDLEIESVPGMGTTVRLILPLAHLADARVYEVNFGQATT